MLHLLIGPGLVKNETLDNATLAVKTKKKKTREK